MNSQSIHTTIKKGFTLLEIVMVISLIGILMLAITKNLGNIFGKGTSTGAKSSLKAFKFAIDEFHEDTGVYPRSLAELYEKPSDPKISKLWKAASGYYLEQKSVETLDPWKKEYQYELTKGGAHPYELWSWGSKEGEDGKAEDKISIWDI